MCCLSLRLRCGESHTIVLEQPKVGGVTGLRDPTRVDIPIGIDVAVHVA